MNEVRHYAGELEQMQSLPLEIKIRMTKEIDGKPVGGKAPELIDILQKYLVKEFIDATTV